MYGDWPRQRAGTQCAQGTVSVFAADRSIAQPRTRDSDREGTPIWKEICNSYCDSLSFLYIAGILCPHSTIVLARFSKDFIAPVCSWGLRAHDCCHLSILRPWIAPICGLILSAPQCPEGVKTLFSSRTACQKQTSLPSLRSWIIGLAAGRYSKKWTDKATLSKPHQLIPRAAGARTTAETDGPAFSGLTCLCMVLFFCSTDQHWHALCW